MNGCNSAALIGKSEQVMTKSADLQKQSFQDRLQRIQSVSEPQPSVTPTRQVSKSGAKSRPASSDAKIDSEPRKLPRATILAFGIGLAVMLAGNVVAFRMNAVPGNFFAEFLAAIGPLPIVGLMLFVIMVGFGFRDKPHVIGLAVGIPVMYFGEPYLASLSPETWVQLYSVDHVDAMLVQAGLRDPMVLAQ